jgi:hypothetical protein
MKSTVFWDIALCSPLKVHWRFGGTYRLPPAFTLISCSAYSSALKKEAICSLETSVDFQRSTRRHIPEDNTLHVTQLFSISWIHCRKSPRLTNRQVPFDDTPVDVNEDSRWWLINGIIGVQATMIIYVCIATKRILENTRFWHAAFQSSEGLAHWFQCHM